MDKMRLATHSLGSGWGARRDAGIWGAGRRRDRCAARRDRHDDAAASAQGRRPTWQLRRGAGDGRRAGDRAGSAPDRQRGERAGPCLSRRAAGRTGLCRPHHGVAAVGGGRGAAGHVERVRGAAAGDQYRCGTARRRRGGARRAAARTLRQRLGLPRRGRRQRRRGERARGGAGAGGGADCGAPAAADRLHRRRGARPRGRPRAVRERSGARADRRRRQSRNARWRRPGGNVRDRAATTAR